MHDLVSSINLGGSNDPHDFDFSLFWNRIMVPAWKSVWMNDDAVRMLALPVRELFLVCSYYCPLIIVGNGMGPCLPFCHDSVHPDDGDH